MFGSDKNRFILIFLLAIVHGAIYALMVPAWQHYDEPGHFEYAWLVANQDRLPRPGDFNQELNRQVNVSMLTSGFFRDIAPPAGLLEAQGQGLPITGFSQLNEPPLYYILASIPLRLMKNSPIEYQLAAVRGVSLALYLVVIWIAWRIMIEITESGNHLRWLTPFIMAAVPGFVDIMTAVNNDVGAVFIVSAFMWMGIRLVKRGFSWLELLELIVLALLSYYTKNTALIVLPILPVVLLFLALRGKLRRWAWITLALVILGGVVLGLDWGESRSWYRTISQADPTRSRNDESRLGEYVFKLTTPVHQPVWLPPLFQLIPLETGLDLQGKTVTLGAWIWADQPAEVSMPAINYPNKSLHEVVKINDTPQFYAFQAKVPEEAGRIWVSLAYAVAADGPVEVYFDGVVLAEGAYPLEDAPQFATFDGAQGLWGGQPFENLLRNGSAELGSLGIAPWLDNLGARILPDDTRLSIVLNSLFDWSALSWYYIFAGRHLFETFWARFGWGNVPLLGQQSYIILWVLAGITLFGFVAGLWRRRRRLAWDLALVLGLFFLISWGLTFMRFLLYFVPRVFLPVARHSAPAMIVSALVLAFGWLEFTYLIAAWSGRLGAGKDAPPHSSQKLANPLLFRISMTLFIIFFILLDIWSVVSVFTFYGWS